MGTARENLTVTVKVTTEESGMLTQDYADRIKPLMELAGQAYGGKRAGSPERDASDEMTWLIGEYVSRGGNMKRLAEELDCAYATVARRVRMARRGSKLGSGVKGRSRPSTDPERVRDAADRLREARERGSDAWIETLDAVYESNVSLRAVASELDMGYYALWAQLRMTQPSPSPSRDAVQETST